MNILGLIFQLIIWLLAGLWYILRNLFGRIFQHNCYSCEHYYLDGVASYGCIGFWKCKQRKDVRDNENFNNTCHWRSCKYFELKRKQEQQKEENNDIQ